MKKISILFLLVWCFAKFSCLNDLVGALNKLSPWAQREAKIVAAPGWNSAFITWYLIYNLSIGENKI